MDVASLSSEIGKGLQWLRKSLLLTQYQLASFTELDYRHYQNIETGRVEVKVETLKRICSTFGIGLSTFFFLLDRRPWLVEMPSRNQGGGDLYVFRVILEQACFRLMPSIQNLLVKWGRDLAEGNRENLSRCVIPCIEANKEGKVLWKNPSASSVWAAEHEGENSIVVALDTDHLRAELAHFWGNQTNSFYTEIGLQSSGSSHRRTCVVVGLKPMMAKVENSIYLALIEVEEQEFSSSVYKNLQDYPRSFSLAH